MSLPQLEHRSKTKPGGRTLVVMGDSISDRGKVADATTYFWVTAKAYLPYMFSELGWPWRLVNIASAAGEKVAQINARLKNGVYPYRPDDVFYLGGINDAHAFESASNGDALANDVIEDLIKPCMDYNIRPIVCTLLPSNDLNTSAKQLGWYRYNDLLRSYAAVNPYMKLVDLASFTYSDPATGYGGLAAALDDNVHPNSKGAARVGKAVRIACPDLILPPGARGAVEGDIYNGATNANKAFLVANNAGTKTASAGPTPTGNVPTGWNLIGLCTNSTGITVVGSIEAATDGGMDWCKVVLDGSGMSGQTNIGWQLAPTAGNVVNLASSPHFDPGDWVEMRAEVEVTAGHVGLGTVAGQILFGSASRGTLYCPRLLNTSGFVAASDLSGFKRIGTYPFQIPADATTIRASIEAKFQTALAAASATIRVRNIELRKVEVPVVPQYIP